MNQPQTFHLIGCDTHYQRLAAANLLVGDTADIQFQHPYAVLLRRIQVLYPQAFQVQVRELLVRAVVLRAHEAVELVVVHVRQPFLELRRLFLQPFGEAVANFINLRIGKLYALAVAHLDVIAVLVLADAFHHVRAGVVQGVLQEVHAVVVAVIAFHQKLVRDFHRLVAARHRILVDVFRIGYPHLRIEQAAHVGGIHARGYPTLPEVEVQVLEGDLFGHGIFQGFKRLFRLRQHFVSLMTIHPIFHVGDFLHHVSGDEAVGNLIAILQRIVEHSSFQGFEYLRLRQITKRLHVGQVHAAVPVQRGGQGFFGRLHSGKCFLREGDGMVEDVRLDELPVLAALQREHVAPRSVHQDELGVVLGVQVAVAHDKLVIVGVQVAAQQGVLLVVFRFVGVEPLVGVAQVDVELCLLRLHPLHVERLECCPVLGDILQHPDLETDAAGMFPYQRAFLQVRLHNALERTGHHRFLLPALPFFRCQGCFLLPHLPFHTLNPSSSLCLKAVLYRIDRAHGRGLFRFPRLYLFFFRLRQPCRLLGGIGIHFFLSHPAQFGTPFGCE